MSSLTKVCEHGGLERKCDVCNYRKELADATATIARLEAEVDRLNGWLADYVSRFAENGLQTVNALTNCQRLEAENAALNQQAGNVLARIHRDGGHYISQHGWEKACVDAEAIVCQLQSENAGLRERNKVVEDVLATAWRHMERWNDAAPNGAEEQDEAMEKLLWDTLSNRAANGGGGGQ